MNIKKTSLAALCIVASTQAFSPLPVGASHLIYSSRLFAAEDVTAKELERVMEDWDMPLVVNAYAKWSGPCNLMAAEYEAAAEELEGKVRFVSLDTEMEEMMAMRLNIDDYPTLLFWDAYKPEYGDGAPSNAKAMLKGKSVGPVTKEKILDLCSTYFFSNTGAVFKTSSLWH